MLSQYEISILTLTAINVIVALGLYVTIISGQLSAIHAALMGIGGYLAGYMAVDHGSPLWITLVIAAAAGGIIGTAISASLFRLGGFYLSIATLSAGQALVTVANNVSSIGGADGMSGITLRVGAILAVISALICIIGVRWWERSLGGLATRALGEDEVAAQACGISLRRVRVLAFLVGGMMAGFAGALQAQNIGIVVPTDLSFQAEVVLFFFVGLGGMGSYTGAVVGAIVVTILPEMLRFSTYDRYLYFGLALTAMMIVRPYGLLPRLPLGHHVFTSIRRSGLSLRGKELTREQRSKSSEDSPSV